jgi:hypothetical protein
MTEMTSPSINRLLETAIYVDDLETATGRVINTQPYATTREVA